MFFKNSTPKFETKGREQSWPSHKDLIFHHVLVKAHQDTCSLRPGGGAARLQGAVVVAVDEGVAVGPGHSPYSYIVPVEEKGKFLLAV